MGMLDIYYYWPSGGLKQKVPVYVCLWERYKLTLNINGYI
jgi:hypothetical protein